jgi:gas vesicle protein
MRRQTWCLHAFFRRMTMNENPGFSGGQMLLAFLGGAAAGAAVALLTAPQSGAKTRALIRDKALAAGDTATAMPKALQGAVAAARDAFAESLARSVDEAG